MTKRESKKYLKLRKQIQDITNGIQKQVEILEIDGKEVEEDLDRIQAKLREDSKNEAYQELNFLTLHTNITFNDHKIVMLYIQLVVQSIAELANLVAKNDRVKFKVKHNVAKQLNLWASHMEAARKAQAEYVR